MNHYGFQRNTFAVGTGHDRYIGLDAPTKISCALGAGYSYMLKDPTPDFMLGRMQQLRERGHPQTNLGTNIQWLVTGRGRPVGCPEVGSREQVFLGDICKMREACVERMSSLRLGNSDGSILDVLRLRVNEGVDPSNRMDEIMFNDTLSLHFEQNEDDHALIRWLLEGEFLETEHEGEIDREPNRTLVDNIGENLVQGLPLHISSTWDPHGRNGPGTMGPAARLLCYWIRGEYLGSCSVRELEFVESDEYSGFELRHEATAPQTLLNGNVHPVNLRRRVRLHALAKIEVFTLVTHGEISERWVLRDSSAHRYQHGLSESLIPGESFLECAERGLAEELGVESSTTPLPPPIPYGPTRVEWGGGPAHFDSQSMHGLPSIVCINPFYAEFDSDPGSDDHDFVDLQDRVPRRQFSIDDAGGTTLNWLPDPSNLNIGETLALIGNEQDIQTNQWYALNYPNLRSGPETKAHSMISAIIGTTLLYHHRTDRPTDSPLELIQPEDEGLLYTPSLLSNGGRGGSLGITDFVRRTHGVSVLVESLVKNGIFEPYNNDSGNRKYGAFLSSIGRLLQPEIDWQFTGEERQDVLADQWMLKWIRLARRHFISELNMSGGIGVLLPWSPQEKSVKRGEFGQSVWHNELRDELFRTLNNPELWEFDGTLSSLLRNQPRFEGPRTIILFKRLEDGSFDVKLREKVDLPIAQLHSTLFSHLRRREPEQSSLDTLDDGTFDLIHGTVNELRERCAMIVRIE